MFLFYRETRLAYAVMLFSSLANATVVEPVLYGYTTWTRELLSFDLATGAATSIATLDYGGITGLAYDATSNTLYGASFRADLLLTIDPLTGSTSVVGPIGIDWISGMTFDSTSGYLFGVDGEADALIRIDPSTGETTTIGSMGYAGVYGLTIDTSTGTMYAIDSFVDKFLAIDMNTGQASVIAELDLSIGGLAFDPTSGMLLATQSDGTNGDLLYSIDPMSGQSTLIGEVGFPYIQGLAFAVPSPGIPTFVGTIALYTLRRRRTGY